MPVGSHRTSFEHQRHPAEVRPGEVEQADREVSRHRVVKVVLDMDGRSTRWPSRSGRTRRDRGEQPPGFGHDGGDQHRLRQGRSPVAQNAQRRHEVRTILGGPVTLTKDPRQQVWHARPARRRARAGLPEVHVRSHRRERGLLRLGQERPGAHDAPARSERCSSSRRRTTTRASCSRKSRAINNRFGIADE